MRAVILNARGFIIIQSLRDNEWLCDEHINAAQAMISATATVEGLQHCNIFSCSQPPVFASAFIQIINADGNHWVTVSTIGCRKDQVMVFDTLYRSVKATITAMTLQKSKFNITMPANSQTMTVVCLPLQQLNWLTADAASISIKKKQGNILLNALKKGRLPCFL